MLRVRRLYFYLMAFASLAMLIAGLITLGQVALSSLLGTEQGSIRSTEVLRSPTARGIALGLIGLISWTIHWRVICSWARSASALEERRSSLRRLYLYAVLLVTALSAYVSARELLENLLGAPLGALTPTDLTRAISDALPAVLIAPWFWLYHARLAAADRRDVGEVGAGATLRRWYAYGLSGLGVLPLAINSVQLFQLAWGHLVDRSALPGVASAAETRAFSSYAATALVALVVWLAHRAWTEGAVARPTWYGEDERHSILRRFYLYLVAVVAVTTTLVSGGQIIYVALLRLLGLPFDAAGGAPLQVALGGPLARVLVFGALWAIFWSALRREAAIEPEVGRQAGVRRLYFYLASGVSLLLLASGVAALLRLAVDWLLPPGLVAFDELRRSAALQLSLVVVSLPTWLVHWSAAQARLGGPGQLDELRSTTRRWYLYVASLAAVGVLLVCGAWLVYDLVLVVLGQSFGRDLQIEVGRLLVNSAVAATLLWYHWWLVLRSDLAVAQRVGPRRTARAVVDGLGPDEVAGLQRFLRESAGSARLKLSWTDEVEPSDRPDPPGPAS